MHQSVVSLQGSKRRELFGGVMIMLARGVPSEPLLPRDRTSYGHSRQVLLLCGCLAAACCLALLVSFDGAAAASRKPTASVLLSAAAADARVERMSREASLVKAQNAKLQREDEMMEAEKGVLERSLLEKQKAAKLDVERKR